MAREAEAYAYSPAGGGGGGGGFWGHAPQKIMEISTLRVFLMHLAAILD